MVKSALRYATKWFALRQTVAPAKFLSPALAFGTKTCLERCGYKQHQWKSVFMSPRN